MPHQLLGILHLLAVLGDTHVDLLRILLDQAQCCRGMTVIAGAQLLPGELGHLVDQLGIKKTLIFGLGLVGLGHERGHGLRIGNSFIHREGQAQERLKVRAETARVVATNRIGHLSEGLRYVFR